jgi:hypothetical protein
MGKEYKCLCLQEFLEKYGGVCEKWFIIKNAS